MAAALTSARPRRRAGPPRVLLVSDNDETLDRLQTYLRDAGMSARGSRQLTDILLVEPDAAAVVLFPDEFQETHAASILAGLRVERPGVLPILVTRYPERFGALAEGNDADNGPVVIAKPAWGFSILDTIRARLEK